jgi:hypothetical protein
MTHPPVYRRPWIGIFHHPPYPPYFANEREKMDVMLKTNQFIRSAEHLKAAITLSEHLASYLREHLSCPVFVVKHPCEEPEQKWELENYNNNPFKKIVQIGLYLRNTQLLHQTPPTDHQKVRLWSNKDWPQLFDERVRNYWGIVGGRTNYGAVTDWNYVPHHQYDLILSRNVVAMEVLDASATNGVLDCIVRNTPVLVNRHPAVIEYLGENYPLYFDHPEQIPDLMHKVLDAHYYIKNLDKQWCKGEHFAASIYKICDSVR